MRAARALTRVLACTSAASALVAGVAPARALSLRGGRSAALMSTAVAAPEAPVEKFRKDYAAPPYRIDSLTLNFDIHEEETLVTASLAIERAAGTAVGVPMELDGEDLDLRAIDIDGTALAAGEGYALGAKEGLTLLSPPAGDKFTLTTTVAIKPQENTQLSGLYKSSGNYVTQCEAEGFRRITYFQDRPDVMATYKVRVEADKAAYPLLLGNGNEVGKGDVGAGRHYAEFVDPFRKPSYLFALVAGKLEGIESTFTTCSGRSVRLAVWSEPHNIDQLDWAMQVTGRAILAQFWRNSGAIILTRLHARLQVAKFLMWVEKNKASMDLLNSLNHADLA